MDRLPLTIPPKFLLTRPAVAPPREGRRTRPPHVQEAEVPRSERPCKGVKVLRESGVWAGRSSGRRGCEEGAPPEPLAGQAQTGSRPAHCTPTTKLLCHIPEFSLKTPILFHARTP
ncbi:hypothetical protein E2C01_013984 [Portunus trituberculatus]|uniref:Uncharacterized protein n=1 Tax=Portunus trituberculatus TaxID=210409 RepID=A0A5B7DHM8_PORTR|nr:hypothetical protein [Portunus trituberculatus]